MHAQEIKLAWCIQRWPRCMRTYRIYTRSGYFMMSHAWRWRTMWSCVPCWYMCCNMGGVRYVSWHRKWCVCVHDPLILQYTDWNVAKYRVINNFDDIPLHEKPLWHTGTCDSISCKASYTFTSITTDSIITSSIDMTVIWSFYTFIHICNCVWDRVK